ncbi:uncharacterized protein [Bemisia tabaci]|uniref:uncharacterized protein n=1 Tax=Bemisia tabaci TaxID=7038 RepID=UPI0008F988DE|nr:PREDICTED: uncharacterized protein LOC109038264 [Bemisia tabaci]XP_018908827.1 PREDICTED: uncharacterized protein LOC109038264 [Bemisia tabaci]XP_018908828.1 PREDICTED: uncharacterized protein LOC109038264 [Bemisia tabaci]XP_018908829.1 PREDICTED: uncharacterized protein LOC109038264 [Bemisia tabaci]
MVLLRSFWTPCIVHSNVKSGSVAVAGYTVATSLVLITLTVYMILRGDSSQLFSPYFEADVRDSLIFYGLTAVLFLILMIFSAVLLVMGIHKNLRGLMLPWLGGMALVIIFQLLWSIWLLYGYYIYIQVVIYAAVYWLWAAYNYYCWLCVYSQYQIINEMQSPNIELLYP